MDGLVSTLSFFRQEKNKTDVIPIMNQKNTSLEIRMITVLWGVKIKQLLTFNETNDKSRENCTFANHFFNHILSDLFANVHSGKRHEYS